ncbi:MAG: 12-oxophytodienoate reductase [Candidatus Hydrogenedentota bacterium]|nr:MAG: 12-oxophytodienoate reductase [Candidatus Hydrogenedentota bacterium]
MSEATATNVDVLFKPYPFGKVTLPNRIAMAPMTRTKCPGNVPNDEVVAYYRRRAEGGVGLIITEGTPPNFKGAHGYPDVPSFYGDDALAGWKKVVDAVHEAGGYIIPQIWHVGSIRQPGVGPNPDEPSMGPSAVVHPSLAKKEDAQAPVAMTKEDIAACVAAYGQSAKDAYEIGFDGLEIHGAHSYLIDQFFWEVTNQRDDEYGGDLAARTKFAVEIVEAMRANVPDDFPIVFRFSQWKQGDYNHKMAKTPEELEKFLMPLSNAGVDIFHCSTRRFNDPEFEGSNLNLAGWTKKITGKPSMTVGSVGLDSDFLKSYAGKEAHTTDISALIDRMEADEFELVAVGRALLSDPAWANKVKEGREEEIVEFALEHMTVLT